MGEVKNSEILGAILRSLYAVTGRRTTKSFSATVIGSIIKTLEQKYEFLKYVRINDKGELIEDRVIAIAPEIDKVKPEKIGKAIEAIVRIVYMDLIGKAGLFFVTELKKNAGDKIIAELKKYDVDLATLQIEQHYLYRSRERKRIKTKGGSQYGVSLLGYTWKNVSSWRYDPNQKVCVLYNKDGEVLDNLHLDTIIENYVKELAESPEEIPGEYETDIEITDKEYGLLRELRKRDMDADTAMVLLNITRPEFDAMVKKLLENELLQYTSYNIIELTEIGVNYVSKKEEAENSDKKDVIKNVSSEM